MKYDYLISYSYANKEFHGFGNLTTTFDKKINNKEDLRNIKEGIEKVYKINNLVILNYILIKKRWR